MVDTFTLVVFLLLIMIAIQVQQWLIAGIVMIILLFTLKSHGLIVLVLLAGVGGFLLNYFMGIELQLVMIGVVVLIVAAVIFSSKKEGPGSYSPGGAF